MKILVQSLFLCACIGTGSTRAFAPTALLPKKAQSSLVASMGANDSDPTKVWYAEIANGIQNLLTNSPLNEGKKALVKSLAGEYDEAEVRAKLDGYINDEAVLMLSFTK